MVSLLLFAANVGPSIPSVIPSYYLANSHLLAGGYNVVNVILVDFRGFDTMGEITVFSVAVLGVLALVGLGTRGQQPVGTMLMVSFPLADSSVVCPAHPSSHAGLFHLFAAARS